MTRTPTFVEDLLQSDAIIEDFDDYVERWHALSDNEEAPNLHDYLGISFEEYVAVCRDRNAWHLVVAARR